MWVLTEGNVERAVQWAPMSPRCRAGATDSPLHIDAVDRMVRAKRRLAVIWGCAIQIVGPPFGRARKKPGIEIPAGGNAAGGVGGNVNLDF